MKSYKMGSYSICEGQVLGDGTFSRVFKGEDHQGQPVAIKALTKCPETKQLIEDQVNIVKMLPKHSTNFCTYLDYHETQKTYFIVLTLCPGTPLSRRLSEGRLPTALSVQIFRRLLASVEELHAAGVMHHDIKPDNIVFNKERTMLVDFGFACKFDPAKDPLNMSLMRGTPAYMSPEILSGRRYNSKSDIWSLGVVLFEMVYGRMPFPGNSKTDILFHIYRRHPLFGEEDGVAASLKRLMGKCLEISVERRINWGELFEWGKSGVLREEGKRREKCCFCLDLWKSRES